MTWTDAVVVALAGLPALIWLAALGGMLVTMARVRPLSDIAPASHHPSVTLVSPACDEAERIERSVRSWLAHDDVALSVVLVDDRSTDGTGEIVDRLAAEDPRITAVHVRELPEGWLGKLNALSVGVERAAGEWLLFADADVELTRGAIARAVAHAEAERLDLVTALPEIASAGFLCDVAWNAIGATTGLARLWRTRDPASDRAFGVGAFILVRREAFERTPGFAWIRLEVADDMGLAILLKHHGHRCDVLVGRGQVRLTWYPSIGEMFVKTQKNGFGILGRFSLLRTLGTAASLLWLALFPTVAALAVSHPALLAPPLVGAGAMTAASIVHARWARRPLLPALLTPLGLVLLAAMTARAGIVGHRIGGIAWRGVVYRSEDLRDVQRFRL